MIQLLLATVLWTSPLQAQSPSVFRGRLDTVVEALVTSQRLGTDSRCSAALRDLPVCLVLEPSAKADAILAELVGGEWTLQGPVKVLARSQAQSRKISEAQQKVLQERLEKIASDWQRTLQKAEDNTAAFGHQIQRQLEEYVRTSGASGLTLNMPLDLVRKACGVDVGAAKLARLKLGEYLYFSNVRDGVHAPLGPRCAGALKLYGKALDAPAVQEAMRAAQRVLPTKQLDAMDLDRARVIVWIYRMPQGLVSAVWLYSPDGVLLESQMGLDPVTSGTSYGQGLKASDIGPANLVKPSQITKSIAVSLESGKPAERPEEMRQLLLAERAAAITDSFAYDVCLALAANFKGQNIAMIVDEGWVKPWSSLLASKPTALSSVIAACERPRGIQISKRDGSVFVKPLLQADSEITVCAPDALQLYGRALFSNEGETLADRCRLVATVGVGEPYGTAGIYRTLARHHGALILNDIASDYHILGLLAHLLPLPASAGSEKIVARTTPAIAFDVRHAIASPFMQQAPESAEAPQITQRASIYTSGQLSQMPWMVRQVSQTSFTFMGLTGKPEKPYDQAEITVVLARLYKNHLAPVGERLEDYQLFRGSGSFYEVRVAVNPEAVWMSKLGQRVTWSGKPARLADLPEGAKIIREALALAASPPP